MAASATTPGKFSKPVILVPMLAVTLLFGLWMRVVSAGWEIILLGIPMILFALVHLAVHILAIRKRRGQGAAYARRILFSHLMFLCAYGLQPGYGDSTHSYGMGLLFAYGALIGARPWKLTVGAPPIEVVFWVDMALLAALMLSWVLVVSVPRSPRAVSAAARDLPLSP